MSPDENAWRQNSASKYLEPLDEYRDALIRLFPEFPKHAASDAFLSPADALALGYFLEHCPRGASVLETSASAGASAFFFASHPNVTRVVGVEKNPKLTDWLATVPDARGETVDLDSLEGVRALDVARAALAEFGEEQEKIKLREAAADDARAGTLGMDAADGAGLMAFVSGLQTREGVRAHLEEILEQNPRTLVLLDNCRHARGPFVQAGIVDFMEQAKDDYLLQLMGDLGSGLAGCSLGILYPGTVADETDKVLSAVERAFSERLDPLRLLSREEDLIANVNRTNQELAQARRNVNKLESQVSNVKENNAKLKENNARVKENSAKLKENNAKLKEDNVRLRGRVSRLEQRNSQLSAHNSSRRYRLADVLADGPRKLPGLRSLLDRRSHYPNS